MELEKQNTITGRQGFSGLSGYTLKMIGIVLMVIDHIHQMFYMLGVPIWFTMIGRVCAPIFLFMTAEGYTHTRSRGKYMLRLWAGYVVMSFMSYAIQRLLPLYNVVLMNGIFGTMFLSVLYMWLCDVIVGGLREKRIHLVVLGLLGMAVPYGLSYLVLPLASASPMLMMVYISLVPTLLFVEGGYTWVLLAVLFYLLRRRRWLQMLALAAVAALTYALAGGFQWLMVFAAIPLFLYNGKPGKRSKYFFYVFYPAHIYILYLLSFLLQQYAL